MIFLDLDGVIVNFVAGVAKHFGTDEQTLLDRWKPGDYSVHSPLGLVDEDAMWRELEKVSDKESWWAGLQPYDNARELMTLLQSTGEKVHILSSPSRDSASAAGKMSWVRTHFSSEIGRRLIITSQKHLLSAPGRLLVDDWDKHTDKWRTNGGQAITFPRIWNSNHEHHKAPLAYVQLRLNNWTLKGEA